MHTESFATFWAGNRLSAFESACLRSFTVRGYPMTLYTFDRIENAPEGVALLDAAAIADPNTLHRFRYEGKANYAHFADYFRYLLFRETGHIWIDSDVLLMRPIDTVLQPRVLALETSNSINPGVMRLEPGPKLDRVIEDTAACMDRELQWGETGPRLVSKAYGHASLLKEAFAPKYFFPVTHDEFWKVFLPEHREECERICSDAFAIHLWNNIVDRLGVWKMLAPPEGSFLYHRFEQDGSLHLFRDIYPEKVMRSMIANWRYRKDPGDLGIAGLSRQVIPSVFRTVRHYTGSRFVRAAK